VANDSPYAIWLGRLSSLPAAVGCRAWIYREQLILSMGGKSGCLSICWWPLLLTVGTAVELMVLCAETPWLTAGWKRLTVHQTYGYYLMRWLSQTLWWADRVH
jgi:hypothetical protein